MTAAYSALLGLMVLSATGSLVSDGDFERGGQGWSLTHGWYEQPAGAGLSAITVVDGEGHGGGKAIKFVGQGKRGIAMQVLPVMPGKYQVTGWIKCENLGTEATILCEWMDKGNKWMSGDPVGSVNGTADWTKVEKMVEAPAGARAVHLDLLTSGVNDGTAWFDGVSMMRVASGFPAPQPPATTVEAAAGQEGALEVRWDPAALTAGAARVLVYCDEQAPAEGEVRLPLLVADAETGSATVQALEPEKTYYVAAALVNGDGKGSALSAEVPVKAVDRQAPRPGWATAERTVKGITVGWSPHVLDEDLATVELCGPGQQEGTTVTLATAPVEKLYKEPRPFYCTEPWVVLEANPAPGRVGVRVKDKSGNVSDLQWLTALETPAAADLPCVLEAHPPTRNIPRNIGPPVADKSNFDLSLLRGEAKGFQLVVHPKQALHNARVQFEAPVHADGRTKLDRRWLAYHFVDYVKLEKNSIATPAEEQAWAAPADYPDELSEDLTRDLTGEGPGGPGAQPIYIRVTAPRDAKPGKYMGTGSVLADEGRRDFTFSLTVEPIVFSEKPRLPFVYWFSWDPPCKELGVSERSTDGWRVLYQLGRLMETHHQRAVVVPWSLVRTWRSEDGTIRHDFRDFDRFVQTFQNAGVDQYFYLSHMGGRTTNEWECKTFSAHTHEVKELSTGDPVERIDSVELLPALQDHIEKMGWLDRFIVHVADEPIPVNIESYKELSARVHAAAPKLPRIDAIHVPDLQGSLEWWCPQTNYFEQWLPEYRKAQAAGNKVMFYVAWVPQGKYANRMIDSSAIKPRVLHWLNAIYDTDGYLHWALNHWTIPLTSLNSPGDQYIAWPSRRYAANSSLRYEAEREGLEDCEIMFMVRDALMKKGMTREQAQARVEEIGRKAVRGFQDYTRDYGELEAVRAELVGELQRN